MILTQYPCDQSLEPHIGASGAYHIHFDVAVQVLSKLGLKKELDTGSMKLCGMRLERLSSLTPLPFAVAQKASLLVQQVVAHANNQPDKKFLKEFATLK